ncbi:Gfo/Idh/MocA family protein [Streptomyces longispororuber]|uniref:Gfo/Idh/MocA family protein n=1 Tax=Streptomyces longispororuber TaxID=68230 RepID=UPI00210A91D1|nr:Gfo/Idh/MocA family oxidoreductase [Streptomyces longispororuber]MCQ4213831.1 Gfo/Idh/MocA family oxidoreductase [Streptomyces longispororuber]
MKVAVLSFAHERAATYARLLGDLPDVELVIADPDGSPDDPSRGRDTARRLGAAYADSWDEVFALRPDAVVVTSETDRRRDLVERAAGAGAHVLCEHPLAADEADAQAMVRVCEEAGVRLSLASPVCFGPAFAAVRQELAKEEVLGDLTTVLGAYNRPRPARSRAAESGALGAGAPPLLDMVDAVLGGTPAQQVYAQANSVLSGDPDVESAALVTVRYADGTVVSIDCSWGPADDASAAGGPTMTFVGDRGSVEFTASPRLVGGFDSATSRERWETRGDDPYAVMIGEFVAAAGRGSGAGPDGAAGVRTLRIVRAARASLRTGQPVELAVPQAARS